MQKAKHTFGALLVAVALNAQAQTPAKELVKNNPVVQLERGQSIDVYGDYTVVGSTFGLNGVNGAAMLFNQNAHVRDYRVTPSSTDGVGRRGTVSIDQHALVVGAPNFQVGTDAVGKINIYNKTWNGTHYSPTVSQSFTETTANTGFGTAVRIADNWIAVGAPYRSVEGGVKLYFRNPGTGVWEDKGWLTLPNFENAPFRYRSYGGPLQKMNASFGSAIDICHNNMIVGAPGIGSFYIFQFNGTTWQFAAEYLGTNNVGQTVAISDEYAASSDGGIFVDVVKKGWGSNPWPALQTITLTAPATGLATDNSKLVIGQSNGGTDGRGQALYYEIRSHQVPGTYNWVNDFVKIGKMPISVAGSPYGMVEYRLVGYSVAIHNNTVVAGAPNTRYTGFADGAGFRGDFSQYSSARKGESEETENILSTASVYPNPATDFVNIATENTLLSATAVNTMGEKTSLPFVGHQVNTSRLAKGKYVISVDTEGGNISQHIVIQ